MRVLEAARVCLSWAYTSCNGRDSCHSRYGRATSGACDGRGSEGVLCMTTTRDSELAPRPNSLRTGSAELRNQPRLSSSRSAGERSSQAALTGFVDSGRGSAQEEEAFRSTVVSLPDVLEEGSARVSV